MNLKFIAYGVVVGGTFAINLGFSFHYNMTKWQNTFKAIRVHIESTHRQMLQGPTYRQTDVGNRVQWLRPLIWPGITKLMNDNIDSTRHHEVEDYVRKLLPKICSTN